MNQIRESKMSNKETKTQQGLVKKLKKEKPKRNKW